MLKEIKNVSQIPGEKKRRWFSSPDFDLFVFFENDEIVEFQLSYNKKDKEKIVIWSKEVGFSHQAVDEGDHPGKIKRSPIIVPDGIFNKKEVLEDFIKESKNIDKKIANFVSEKLNSY
ncbi:MAG: hypothetical protein WHS77_09745 [Brevinematales bacterium]